MPYYAVTRTQTWQPGLAMEDQPSWDEHAAFMDELVDEGFIALGGPIGRGPKVLLIVSAASERDIDARLAEDPWTTMGLLSTDSIARWNIRLGALAG